MKKWIACLALAVCGCGGGNSLVGTWKGSASGWDVTVKVSQQVSGSVEAVSGVLSTNKANCFTSALLSGSLAETTVDIVSRGSGSASSATFIQIQGEFGGDKITGFFTVIASPDTGCAQDRGAITLTRQ